MSTENLASRLQEVEFRLAAAAKASGRERKDVTLLAVSKTWPAETVRAAFSLGIRHFGENYVQEFSEKKRELADLEIDWQFIGHLQSNKVKNIVNEISLIHSVDRMKLAQEISSRAAAKNEQQKILIEVNIAEEASKSGVSLSDLPKLIDEIQELPSIQLCGLMIMPPLNWHENELRRAFNQIRDERDRLASQVSGPHHLLELSMGTSQDYVLAVEAGATIVRLGTVLFGSRS